MCELKAARRYPYTANALDAAAIAILFATFFAAHALWNLIPAVVTFALLAAVTALAVLLSIRRESLFIAVLGLLGGFATPALLSTGENRPIPLFAYLVLLNVGLAWVAYRQVWPVLTVLTLVLTTLYQWTWVYQFLSANDLSLAIGIFAVFPVVSIAALAVRPPVGRAGLLRRRRRSSTAPSSARRFRSCSSSTWPRCRTTARTPAAPVRLSAADRRRAAGDRDGARAAGAARGRGGDDGVRVGGVADDRPIGRATGRSRCRSSAHSSALYLFAPTMASRFGRPLAEPAVRSVFAAPALLFVFPVVAAHRAGRGSPLAPVRSAARPGGAVWLAGVGARSRRRVLRRRRSSPSPTQAVWSATYLTVDTLRLGGGGLRGLRRRR